MNSLMGSLMNLVLMVLMVLMLLLMVLMLLMVIISSIFYSNLNSPLPQPPNS